MKNIATMPFLGRIVIENGIVQDLEYWNQNYSEVVIDGVSETFHNCYLSNSFTDSHAHIYGLGDKLLGINLESCKSKNECIELLSKNNLENEWIVGRGWNEELWDHTNLPTKEDLDIHFPNKPVFLVRVDGHAAWCNSIALKLAQIDKNTSNPEGGAIVKAVDGKPSGILIDNAIELVRNYIPKETRESIKSKILASIESCVSQGITAIHDMDVNLNFIDIYEELDKENKLDCRVFSFIRGFDDSWSELKITPKSFNNFHICGLKYYSDGALGSRGAAMLDEYKDDKSNFGLTLVDPDFLFENAKKGVEAGFQIAVHAIGDAANRMVLDVYQKIRKTNPQVILRIEHSQIVHPDDIPRFANFDIIASVQPIHYASDVPMARKRLEKAISWAYPWKSLLDNKIKMIAGSDFPIESNSVFEGIYAFITRNPLSNKAKPFGLNEKISLQNALAVYTVKPQQALGNFSYSAGVEVGNQADFILINNDLQDLDKVRSTQVVATYLKGKKVFSNN